MTQRPDVPDAIMELPGTQEALFSHIATQQTPSIPHQDEMSLALTHDKATHFL